PQGRMPSIIDRLIDPDSAGTAWMRGYSLDQMIETVQRDMEDLLNTRQTQEGTAGQLPEVSASIIAYGLPDLTSLNPAPPRERENIARIVEEAVARFEPRLQDVRATLLDAGDGHDRQVRFRIEARLCVDPAPEVAFDTVLELTTGHYSVKPTDSPS